MSDAKNSIAVSWDDSIKCVQAKGVGFVNGDNLRVSMNKGLELLKEKKASRWLADMLEQKVLTAEDQEWTVQDWTPRAVAAGLRKSAFVIPKSAIAQLSLRRLTSKVGNIEINMAYFDNIEEARAWLKAN